MSANSPRQANPGPRGSSTGTARRTSVFPGKSSRLPAEDPASSRGCSLGQHLRAHGSTSTLALSSRSPRSTQPGFPDPRPGPQASPGAAPRPPPARRQVRAGPKDAPPLPPRPAPREPAVRPPPPPPRGLGAPPSGRRAGTRSAPSRPPRRLPPPSLSARSRLLSFPLLRRREPSPSGPSRGRSRRRAQRRRRRRQRRQRRGGPRAGSQAAAAMRRPR